MKLDLQATPEEVMRAVEALEQFAGSQHIPEQAILGLALALEECGSNIVNHGLLRDARQLFHVTFEREGDQIFIELRDRGPEFDPTTASVRTSADEHDLPGGWGIMLVRRYIDEIIYKREHGENVLRLTKRFGAVPAPTQVSEPDRIK